MNKLKIQLLVDSTLGRLARWLRILGYDTAYLPDGDDFAVMRLARAQDRLVLTRSRSLVKRRGIRALLIERDALKDQLRQVWATVGPPPDPPRSRCPVCNQPLAEAAPELVAARVPPFVRRKHARFVLCVACDRLYWPGSHWRRMQALIAELRDETGSATMETRVENSEA